MAGVADVPFRQVAWDCGAGYLVGEMVSSAPQLWDSDKSRLRRVRVQGATPNVVQLAGSEPEQIAAAALRQWQAGAEIIDLNFGCPAKKVCRKAAGSALLADEDLVAAIAGAAVAAVPIPVTAKIRTGPEPSNRNGVSIALRLQDAGVAAIAVHGRTRACRFHGAVEWDTAAAIKQAVAVPVFVNGDIDSPQRARAALAHTAADGVMIGRAALGQPWLLAQIAALLQSTVTPAVATASAAASASTQVAVGLPDWRSRWQLAAQHLTHMHEFYGPERGLRIARKHLGYYLDCAELGHKKQDLLRLQNPAQQLQAVQALVRELPRAA